MVPVSLTFFRVPVSSWALACAAKAAATTARLMIRRLFIRPSPHGLRHSCTNWTETHPLRSLRLLFEHDLLRKAALCSGSCCPQSHAMAGPLHGRGSSYSQESLFVGIRIRRVRRLGELVLLLRAH